MARCEVCSQWAGLFRKVHPACADRHQRELDEQSIIETSERDVSQRIFAVLKPAAESGITAEEVAILIEPIATKESGLVWRGLSVWDRLARFAN